MIKNPFNRRGRLAAVAAAALMLVVSALSSPIAAEARPTDTSTSTRVAFPWPSVSPNAEKTEFGKWSQQQATDWVNNCPPGRYCTWIRDGEYYSMFQFYRCGVYTLSRFLGISNYFNNQNVTVQLLGSRHEVLRTHGPGSKFITNWDPVFYINLCT